MKLLARVIDDNVRAREVVEDCVAELGHYFHAVGSKSKACAHVEVDQIKRARISP